MPKTTFVIDHAQRKLPQIIRAFRPAGRFPNRLNCRQQHSNQNSNNSNHDQQLDQRESSASHIHSPYEPITLWNRTTCDQFEDHTFCVYFKRKTLSGSIEQFARVSLRQVCEVIENRALN